MSYDEKGNADHYSQDRINVIVKMERVWGTKATMIWCEITEFKYRLRMGKKEDQSLDQELLKADWYLKMAKILQNRVGTFEEVFPPDENKLGNPQA